ncbi:MAG: acyl-CoA dehydrogenase family protein [Gammaproteobacteria bacterium]|nr:acyl-CoA dehydrogenase family protein [Gammaproteobacteria bacterium]
MFAGLSFDPVRLPEDAERLRDDVRRFVAENLPSTYLPNSDFNEGHSVEFSRGLGARGWIGMTWPTKYGGAAKTFFERYVVTEELLAAGAPVSAHWIADRQSGPLMLRYGTEAQRQKYLPGITRGEIYFSIGMSEPNSGSDLASVRTRAEAVEGGWLVNGTKLWSTDAHRNHYMIALVRTEAPSENRHAGLSQMIVDLSGDGVNVRPIRNIAGDEDFNEVVFDDAFIPDANVVGEPGNGWEQVTSELGYERSGPERFLSAFRVFVEFVRTVGADPDPASAALIGRLASHFMTLRKMSISVAGMLQAGRSPGLEAALVKQLGNDFEKLLPELVRLAVPELPSGHPFRQSFEQTLLHSPSFTIRGGTREILRGVVARGLGLR